MPSKVPACTPTRMNPAWLIDEYASMRFTSVCTTASTEPTSIVATASAYTYGFQSSWYAPNVTTNTRSNPAKPAAFTADAMNPTTGVGAPWYTRGVHEWNGTAATLNPKPTRSNPNPASSSADGAVGMFEIFGPLVMTTRPNWAMRVRFVEPVAPYTRAMPYRKKADENAPSTKYFMPASCDSVRRRCI